MNSREIKKELNRMKRKSSPLPAPVCNPCLYTAKTQHSAPQTVTHRPTVTGPCGRVIVYHFRIPFRRLAMTVTCVVIARNEAIQTKYPVQTNTALCPSVALRASVLNPVFFSALFNTETRSATEGHREKSARAGQKKTEEYYQH